MNSLIITFDQIYPGDANTFNLEKSDYLVKQKQITIMLKE